MRQIYRQGNYYHIYNRGRSRLPICHDPRDYVDITRKLKRYSYKYKIVVVAYVLLPNHYHFLVRQDGIPRATLLPQRIFNSYSKIYNLKYRHSGTIFQGRPKGKRVHSQAYLLHLCRYIHANPVRHGLTKGLDDWPYSNFHEWMGNRPGQLIDHAFIKTYFASAASYRSYVEALLRR